MSIRTKIALVITVSVVVPLVISMLYWVVTLGGILNEEFDLRADPGRAG